jgi:predicted ATPase/class 3 adenylate cyclase
MAAQPTGTVTLLFTDVEGSTRLLQRLGQQRYGEALDLHRRVLREAFERHGGYEVDYEGDSFFVAFAAPSAAVAAAAEAQEALARADWPGGRGFRVRIGIHTGDVIADPPKYVGLDVHLAARIMAAAHGGQVLLSQPTRSLVETPALDLGEHTLKDFDDPVRLFQLGSRRCPPLLTLANTNLVRPATSFVGRKDELAQVLALLRGNARLVTLTGPGGTGKTRLALEAAFESIGEWPDGVWFVPLGPITGEAFVEPAVAGAVGARGDLRDHLRTRRLLLVLDNMEHLRRAPVLVADLLASCPDLRVLATSRTRLDISAEHEYPVPTLPTDEAAELFVKRARLRTPGFQATEPVLEIARRLDGLPLALELAAARVKVLTPTQILERLRSNLEVIGRGPSDLPEWQRTLRATVEWSYELLDEKEQALFRRLGVFAGSFDLEAAEAVGGGDLDTLASLLDKSLLRPAGEGRFAMLYVLREYARERLDTEGETYDVSLAHATHFSSVPNRLRPQFKTSRRREALDRLEADQANFVRAIEWAIEVDPGLAVDLYGKLMYLWWDRSQRDGWVLAERVLAAAPLGQTEAQASALQTTAALALGYGDLEQAASLAEQALEIYDERDEPVKKANILVFLGAVHGALGRGNARATIEEAVATLEASGDDYGATIALANLSDLALQDGDLAAAARFGQEGAAKARTHGFDDLEATATFNQALALIGEGDPGAAEIARSALRLAARSKMHLFVGMSLFAVAAAVAGAEPRRAAVLLGAAEGELQGARLPPVEAAVHEAALGAARDALDASAFEDALEEGRLLTREDALELSLARVAAPVDT